jgi:hypothetical protein
MTLLEEIEDKIARLSRDEFFELVRQLREKYHDEWDRQFEEDVAAGRLDSLLQGVNGELCRER